MTWTATEKTICVDPFKCYPVITAVSLSPHHKGGLAGEASAPEWYKIILYWWLYWSGSHRAPNVNFWVCFFLEFFYNLCRKTQILHLEKNIFHKYWLFCSGFILFKFDLVTFCLLSVIHKQWLKEYIYYTGFSLSFKVDSYDVNIGGLETKCCRQLQDFTFSLYPLPQKVEGSNVQVGGFLAGCRHLTKTLTTSTNQSPWPDSGQIICHRCAISVIWCRCVPGSKDGWLYSQAIMRLCLSILVGGTDNI